MPEPKKEKTLIELAREHMEAGGADPKTGVDVPEAPATTGEAAQRPIHKDEPAKEEVVDAFDGTVNSAVGDLLSKVELNLDWRTLELPSRGKAYINSDGTVQIRPFTFAQERKLRSIKKASQGGAVMKSLFKDCVTGLDYDSMTLEDKSYVLFKLREISYGNEYTVNIECEGCNARNTLVLEIDKVPVKYAEDDHKEPFSIMLPDSKQEVKFVSPRSKDEDLLSDVETLTVNLWRFALSVGKYKDERILKEFFSKTTVRDIVFFRESLTENRYGMNKTMSFECAGCGEVGETHIPFSENFFSVS